MDVLVRGNEENALNALQMIKKMKALASRSAQQPFEVYDKDFQKAFYNFCCTMHERVPAVSARLPRERKVDRGTEKRREEKRREEKMTE